MACDTLTYFEVQEIYANLKLSNRLLEIKFINWLLRINDIPCPPTPTPDGQSIVLKLIAGEPKPAGVYKVMVLMGRKCFIFNKDNPAHENRIIGVSEKAGRATDEIIEITQYGKIVDNAEFSTYPDDVYFGGAAGVLSNTAPAAGIVQQVGYVAKNSDSLDSAFIVEKTTPTNR